MNGCVRCENEDAYENDENDENASEKGRELR
jgi:hypothetical protein